MVVVPDTDRKFPLSEIQYIDGSVNDFWADLLNIRRVNCPNYTDESLADFGNHLLWLDAVLAKLLITHIARVSRNCYLSTADSRIALRRICDYLGYTLNEAAPASVTVTFTLEGGHPEFTIYAGTQVGTLQTEDTDAIIFETVSDQICTVGMSTVDIVCSHGYTVSDEILGSSDATANQLFKTDVTGAIWESETLEVDPGTGFETWTRVDDWTNSDPDDKHYVISKNDDDEMFFQFGDGERGAIPASGTNNIRVTYRVGGGMTGNVAANSVTELVSSISYVASVNNTAAATGGTDKETMNHAKRVAPYVFKSGDRAVTREDIQYLLENYVSPTYGRIAKAAIIEKSRINSDVRIVPENGGYPSDGFKQEVSDWLETKRLICSYIQVLNPIYLLVNVTIDLYIENSVYRDECVENVRRAIITFMSPTYRDADGVYPHEFGTDLYLSKLYEAIEAVVGVEHVDVTAPTGNVSVDEDEIVDINTLTINSYQGGVLVAYTNLKTEF